MLCGCLPPPIENRSKLKDVSQPIFLFFVDFYWGEKRSESIYSGGELMVYDIQKPTLEVGMGVTKPALFDIM